MSKIFKHTKHRKMYKRMREVLQQYIDAYDRKTVCIESIPDLKHFTRGGHNKIYLACYACDYAKKVSGVTTGILRDICEYCPLDIECCLDDSSYYAKLNKKLKTLAHLIQWNEHEKISIVQDKIFHLLKKLKNAKVKEGVEYV